MAEKEAPPIEKASSQKLGKSKYVFQEYYRDSYMLGKLIYTYATRIVDAVNLSGNGMEMKHVVSVNSYDGESEYLTERY